MWTAALLVSIQAVAKIVLMCAGGAYLEKAGILHKEMRKGVSQAFVQLLLPCLLFTRILPTMSTETLPKLGWLALANLLYVTLGLGIGYVAVLVTKPPRSMRRILMATPAIGHANSIPFMLVALIMAEVPSLFPQDSSTTAQGYVGLYLVMHSITLWGVGLNVIKKEKEDEPALAAPPRENGQTTDAVQPQALGRSTLSASAVGQGSSAVNLGEARQQEWARTISGLELGSPITSASSQAPGASPCHPRSWQRFVPKWVNRPMATAVLTALLGLIPGLKSLLVPTSGPLNCLFGAMQALGSAGPAVSLLAVGANFVSDGFPRPSLIGYGPLAALIVGRLLILPACCISLWVALRHYVPFFPSDPAVMLVMCIECCTPTAYNLVTVCILNGVGARELTAGLFYQNLVAIPALTAWVTVIMSFVL